MKRSKIVVLVMLVSFMFCGCATQNSKEKIQNPNEVVKQESAKQNSNESVVDGLPKLEPELEWAVFQNIAMPVPVKWHQFSQDSTFVSSVESVKENGIFETGLTIQVIQDVQKTYKAPASVAALYVLLSVKKDTDNKILNSSYNEKEGIKIFTMTYVNNPEIVKPIQIHKLIFADDKTSILDVITFESPSETWEKYWNQFGKFMLNRIAMLNTEGQKK